MVAGNALQTQVAIDAGILPHLHSTIHSDKRAVRKETCWILSNIAAGTRQQLNALILNNFLPLLINVTKTDESEVKFIIIYLDTERSHMGDLQLDHY
jgi:importin subunit alpha-1